MALHQKVNDWATAALSGGFALAVGWVLKVLEHFHVALPDWAWTAWGVLCAVVAIVCAASIGHGLWIWLGSAGLRSALAGSATKPPGPRYRRIGPLEWNLNGYHGPIIWSRSSGAPLWAGGFAMSGHNPGRSPIDIDAAYVRSDLTNESIELKVDGNTNVAAHSILPGADISLVGWIEPTDPTKSAGIVVDQFRHRFGRFTFVYVIAGKTYERHFSLAQVDRWSALADRLTRAALPPPKPRLAPRSPSPPNAGQ